MSFASLLVILSKAKDPLLPSCLSSPQGICFSPSYSYSAPNPHRYSENVTAPPNPTFKPWPRRGLVLSILRWTLIVVFATWCVLALTLIALRWIDPPTTAVHIERRFQAWVHGTPYHERYRFIPLNEISPNLQHAVIAAEDGRFYQHHGFDWQQIQIAAEDDMEGRRKRGASTLTQQLVKNLFFGTSRSFVRKGVEATLVPVAELFLGKQRILELYLNVVEWGPGIYGADAVCHADYGIAASKSTANKPPASQQSCPPHLSGTPIA